MMALGNIRQNEVHLAPAPAPIEPAQWPPSPTIRGDAGFSLDALRSLDRI